MEYMVSIVYKSSKSSSSVTEHMSSNVMPPSEYPSFRHLRRNELSLTLSAAVPKPAYVMSHLYLLHLKIFCCIKIRELRLLEDVPCLEAEQFLLFSSPIFGK